MDELRPQEAFLDNISEECLAQSQEGVRPNLFILIRRAREL